MNNLKISLTISLLLVSMLGGSQAFAESVNVKIGKFAEDKELIIFDDFDSTYKADHRKSCNELGVSVPAYIRIKGVKIQPVCWYPARGDGMGFLVPLGEDIDFYEDGIKFSDAVLDLDEKKIR